MASIIVCLKFWNCCSIFQGSSRTRVSNTCPAGHFPTLDASLKHRPTPVFLLFLNYWLCSMNLQNGWCFSKRDFRISMKLWMPWKWLVIHLKAAYDQHFLVTFYKQYVSSRTSPNLAQHVHRYIALFGSTYCLSSFSWLKNCISKILLWPHRRTFIRNSKDCHSLCCNRCRLFMHLETLPDITLMPAVRKTE